MSIYSGFATRQQENFYDKLIFKLIELMQQKIVGQYMGCKYQFIISILKEISFDERTFARKVVKIYRTCKKMEENKHLEPNFSKSFKEMSEILLQNYRDASSFGASSILGAQSNISGLGPIPSGVPNGGFNNNLKDLVASTDL